MKYLISLLIAFLFIGCASSHDPKRVFGNKNNKTFVASFDGKISQIGCRSSSPLYLSGYIQDGMVHMSLPYNQTLKVALSQSGSFEGEAFLRAHAKGKKMQSYKGQILDGKLELKGWFGVKGHSSTYCSAQGSIVLK